MVLGLAGLIAGVSAWFRPVPEPRAAVYSEQEVAAATKAVCEAYSQFSLSGLATSNRNGGGDPTLSLVVAVNIRLALYAGSDYMLQALNANPAAPIELGRAIRDLSATYQEVAIKQLAELPRAELDPLADKAKKYSKEVDAACR